MNNTPAQLQKFGLSEIESHIYLGLLEFGASTISDIAKKLDIKRTTTHINVESLIRKGLVSQTKHGVKRQLIAEPPENLAPILERRKSEIKSLERFLPDLIDSIHKDFPDTSAGEKTSIKYYEGKEAVQSIYREIVKAKKVYSFVNADQVYSVFPHNWDVFQTALEKSPELEMWEILEDSRSSRDYTGDFSDRYHYLFTPEGITFSDTDFMIFDCNVAIVHVDSQNPTAVIINSEAIAKGLIAVHKIVWNVLSSRI